VNCPKCGFVQEERLDCKKCGVVFAKYYAMYPPDGSSPVESAESFDMPPPSPVDPYQIELSEMRHSLRELTQRFNELDFERIERNRMRNEIRAVEQKLEEGLSRLEAHFAAHAQPSEPAATKQEVEGLKTELLSTRIDPLARSVGRLEESATATREGLAALSEARLPETLKALESRHQEVELRFKELLTAGNGQQDSLSPSQVGMALKSVEELRTSLENVTVRYSEIGELKKNQLVLSNRLDSLRQMYESTGKEALKGISGRLSELDQEVRALRAEVRQSISKVEVLAQQPTAPEAPLLREEIDALNRQRSDEGEKMRLALGALESKLNESLLSLSSLPEKVKTLASQIQNVEQRCQPPAAVLDRSGGNRDPKKIQELDHSVASLRKEAQELQARLQNVESKLQPGSRPPNGESEVSYQSDLRAIRENLDDLRRFMSALGPKF
jgi:uncharacterized protein YukE/archaellum component FlaC